MHHFKIIIYKKDPTTLIIPDSEEICSLDDSPENLEIAKNVVRLLNDQLKVNSKDDGIKYYVYQKSVNY